MREARHVCVPRSDWASAIVAVYRRQYGSELSPQAICNELYPPMVPHEGAVPRVALGLSAADACRWFARRDLALYVLDYSHRVRAWTDPRAHGQPLNASAFPRIVYALQHPFGPGIGAGAVVPTARAEDSSEDDEQSSDGATGALANQKPSKRRTVELYTMDAGVERWGDVVAPQ